MMRLKRTLKRTYVRPSYARWVLFTTLALAACSSDNAVTNPSTPHAVSLSVMTGATISNLPNAATAIVAVNGTDTLIITKAQLVLSRLELTTGTGMDCESDDSNDSLTSSAQCREIERGFVLIDLPIDTAVHTFVDASIPAGSYSSLEARLQLPRNGSDLRRATTFLAAHPEFANANVRVEGTFHGTPFVYTSAIDTRLELEFSPPLVVDSSGLNITIRVDVPSWFQDGTGAFIDPATANIGGVNNALVDANIRRSFHAFSDRHRRGHDDGQDAGDDDDHHGGDDQSGHQ